jgi:hypothetical protein
VPRNADKRRCSIANCQAWAVRGSDLCASHAGLARGGAPAGNANARTHGLYSRHFTPDELEVLLNPPSDLADEIALSRVLTARLMAALSQVSTTEEMVQVAGLALRAAATSAKLLHANKVLAGDSADDLAGAIGAVLDQLGSQWGVKL